MLSHGNLIADVAGSSLAFKFHSSDVWVSSLTIFAALIFYNLC